MVFDPVRIVHCARHKYQNPLRDIHHFWAAGVAPEGEAMVVKLLPRSEQARPGETARQLIERGRDTFMREGFAMAKLNGQIDVNDPIAMMELGRKLSRLWNTSPKMGIPSPKDQVLQRFFALLDWWVCEDNGGEMGDPIIPKSYRFPASCLAEGLLQEKVLPDGQRNRLKLIGMGNDADLQPYKGQSPERVAYWAALFHFGYPRINRVRMQVVKGGNKRELPNVEAVPDRPDFDVDEMRALGLIRTEVAGGQ